MYDIYIYIYVSVQYCTATVLYLCTAVSRHHRHIHTVPARYRFTCETGAPPAESRKRRQPDHADLDTPSAQRPKVKENGAANPDADSWWQDDEAQPSSSNGIKAPKLFRADTANAVSTLCAISRSGRGENTAAKGAVGGSSTRGGGLDTAGAGRNRGDHIAATGAVEGNSMRGGSVDTAGAGRNRGENVAANGAGAGISTREGSLGTAGAGRNGGDGAAQGASQEEAGGVGVVEREGTPASMLGMLQVAACALCSEPLLDVCVLPCPHSFCRLCWADHVEKEGTK